MGHKIILYLILFMGFMPMVFAGEAKIDMGAKAEQKNNMSGGIEILEPYKYRTFLFRQDYYGNPKKIEHTKDGWVIEWDLNGVRDE